MPHPILTVFAKEVRESLRDRRTLVSALLFGPLFGPVILAIALQFLVNRSAEEADRPLPVAVSHGERAPNLLAHLAAHGVEVTRVEYSDAEARAAVAERRHRLVLAVPAEHPARAAAALPAPLVLYGDDSDTFGDRRAARLKAIVAQYGAGIARGRLLVRGLDPRLAAPIVVQDVDVSTARGRSVTVLGTLSYLVLVAMLLGGLYLAIDATAGERERGSLEPLLATPVPREQLIYGKILASAAFMLVSLALTVVACAVALQFVGLEDFGMTARLDAATVARIVLAAAPLALPGAALMTVVASYTRSYREAQTWLGVLLLLPTLPIMFVGLAGLKATTPLMAVPSLSQHFLITALLRGDAIPPLHVVLSAGACVGLGALLAWLAGRLYRRESLLG
jgi:sodium transport system permease protein